MLARRPGFYQSVSMGCGVCPREYGSLGGEIRFKQVEPETMLWKILSYVIRLFGKIASIGFCSHRQYTWDALNNTAYKL